MPANPIQPARLRKVRGMKLDDHTLHIRPVITHRIVQKCTRILAQVTFARKLTNIEQPFFTVEFIIGNGIYHLKKRLRAEFVKGIRTHHKMVHAINIEPDVSRYTRARISARPRHEVLVFPVVQKAQAAEVKVYSGLRNCGNTGKKADQYK